MNVCRAANMAGPQLALLQQLTANLGNVRQIPPLQPQPQPAFSPVHSPPQDNIFFARPDSTSNNAITDSTAEGAISGADYAVVHEDKTKAGRTEATLKSTTATNEDRDS